MENLLPLVEAVTRVTGLRPHLSSVIRWGSRGSKGVHLQTKVVGGRRYTTTDWVLEFVENVNQVKNGDPTPMATPKQQDSAAKKSAKKLAERLSR